MIPLPNLNLSQKAQSDALGGTATAGPLYTDSGAWNVQIGSGLNVASMSGILPMVLAGVALFMAAKWLRKS